MIGRYSFLIFIVLSIALIGCHTPNDGVPVYMQIDSVRVDTLPFQGAPTHNITDVWVEANTDNLGAYKLPCNFPVLQENEIRFVVSAGVKESGQSGIRVVYPFYKADTFSITAARGENFVHHPAFKYVNAAKFTVMEDFDFSNGFANDTLINRPEGGRCAAFSVTTTDSAREISYTTPHTLPAGQEIWLELDYKCDIPFFVGFYAYIGGIVSRNPVMLVTQQSEWHKVYVKFSNYVGAIHADKYNLYFEALRPYGTNGGTVYIDNVKLINF